jgi:radical SAM protein with 4Fe4S-binding SPASM domain
MAPPLLRNILDELCKAGFLWLSFTGGEPLLREDFADIYTYAKKKGFLVIILTNGTLINERLIEVFKQYRPFYLDITIHAAEPGLYEKISGVQDAFKNLLKGLRLLRKNRIPFKLKTTVMTLNSGQLSKIRSLARELDVPFTVSPTIHACLDGDKTPLNLRIRPQAMADFFKDDDIERGCSPLYTEQYAGLNKNHLFRCGIMTFSVFIDPCGYLIGCECLRQSRFDLKKGSFKEGYEFILNATLSRKFKNGSKCAACEIRDVCELCPGIAQLELGDWSSPVEYFCRVAKIRDDQRKKAFVKNC